jgi:hypothetical protein
MILGDVETVGVVCEGEAGMVWEKLEMRAVFVWVVGWKVQDLEMGADGRGERLEGSVWGRWRPVQEMGEGEETNGSKLGGPAAAWRRDIFRVSFFFYSPKLPPLLLSNFFWLIFIGKILLVSQNWSLIFFFGKF